MPAKKSMPDAMRFRPIPLGQALNHSGKAHNEPVPVVRLHDALNGGGRHMSNMSINSMDDVKTDVSIPNAKGQKGRTDKQMKANKNAKRGS
jgi:hypothetical protein